MKVYLAHESGNRRDWAVRIPPDFGINQGKSTGTGAYQGPSQKGPFMEDFLLVSPGSRILDSED